MFVYSCRTTGNKRLLCQDMRWLDPLGDGPRSNFCWHQKHSLATPYTTTTPTTHLSSPYTIPVFHPRQRVSLRVNLYLFHCFQTALPVIRLVHTRVTPPASIVDNTSRWLLTQLSQPLPVDLRDCASYTIRYWGIYQFPPSFFTIFAFRMMSIQNTGTNNTDMAIEAASWQRLNCLHPPPWPTPRRISPLSLYQIALHTRSVSIQIRVPLSSLTDWCPIA